MERVWDERADVGDVGLTHTEDEHRARYVWASARVAGRGLDIACGTGYGSRILAESCEVTGVDQDEDTISAARERVPKAAFLAAEVPPLPFDDASFDWAVSFETVEHLDRDAEFVAELRRVVVPSGHVFLSTPNRAVSSPNEAKPQNPYHVREYLLPELESLVRNAGFENVDVYFQRKERRRLPEFFASAVIARVPQLCQPGRWWDRLAHGSSDILPWISDVTHPMYWVLDCH
jgi:ubiquinone/menaquinone biosynthesis C-methylase UbiE